MLWWFTRKPQPLGAASGIFLAGYAVARFSIEFVRLPDEHIGYLAGDWLTMGHVLTLPVFFAGMAMLIWAYSPKRKEITS